MVVSEFERDCRVASCCAPRTSALHDDSSIVPLLRLESISRLEDNCSVNSRQNHGKQKAITQNLRRAHPWASALTFVACLVMVEAFAAEQAKVDFARDIQPIFIKRCFECHGPDKQKSDLRLDRKADALKGGKSGKPLLLLFARVRGS